MALAVVNHVVIVDATAKSARIGDISGKGSRVIAAAVVVVALPQTPDDDLRNARVTRGRWMS